MKKNKIIIFLSFLIIIIIIIINFKNNYMFTSNLLPIIKKNTNTYYTNIYCEIPLNETINYSSKIIFTFDNTEKCINTRELLTFNSIEDCTIYNNNIKNSKLFFNIKQNNNTLTLNTNIYINNTIMEITHSFSKYIITII